MRDPVTVSTGITYDRLSIERWVQAKHSSSSSSSSRSRSSLGIIRWCPVTKQPLINNDGLGQGPLLIPNHNLRRLIHSWCSLQAHNTHRFTSTDTTTTSSPLNDVYDDDELLEELRNLSTSRSSRSPHDDYESRIKCLQRLRSIKVDHGHHHRRRILESPLAVRFLAEMVVDSGDVEALTLLDEIAIDLMIAPQHLKDILNNNTNTTPTCSGHFNEDKFIESLVTILFLSSSSSSPSPACCSRLLRFLYSVAHPNTLASASHQLFSGTVRMLRQSPLHLLNAKSALKLLIDLNPWGRNRVKAAEAGVIQAIIDDILLLNNNNNNNSSCPSRRICELALAALHQLCGCAEGRAALVGHAAGLAVVSKKILRVSGLASDRAVKILTLVAKNSATSKVLSEMLEVGVVSKLCLVLQVDFVGDKTKERAKELLKLHSTPWRNSPCIPPHLASSYPPTI